MFSATVINFLLFSLNTLTEVVALVVYIREALVLDIDYPFTEKQELVNNMGAFQNVDIVMLYMWSGGIPVSIKLSLRLSPVLSIQTRRSHCSAISLSFGGLGPSSQINSG